MSNAHVARFQEALARLNAGYPTVEDMEILSAAFSATAETVKAAGGNSETVINTGAAEAPKDPREIGRKIGQSVAFVGTTAVIGTAWVLDQGAKRVVATTSTAVESGTKIAGTVIGEGAGFATEALGLATKTAGKTIELGAETAIATIGLLGRGLNGAAKTAVPVAKGVGNVLAAFLTGVSSGTDKK